MRIVGADLSLASTGLADLRLAVNGTYENGLTLDRVQTEAGTGHFRAQHARMCTIRDGVRGVVLNGPRPDLVVVEAPAFGSKTPYQHDLSGNWWRVVDMLLELAGELRVLLVNPTKVKIYATGSGATSGPNKVDKKKVAAAVRTRYGVGVARAIDGNGSDVVDAFVLAAIGARVLGSPIEARVLPANHLRALDDLDLSGILTGMPAGAW